MRAALLPVLWAALSSYYDRVVDVMDELERQRSREPLRSEPHSPHKISKIRFCLISLDTL